MMPTCALAESFGMFQVCTDNSGVIYLYLYSGSGFLGVVNRPNKIGQGLVGIK